MVLPRPTALRASSVARFARSARSIRSAELQPWQQMLQRRAYASGPGPAGAAKKSDLPWMLSAVAATAAGLYIVVNQDLSHGEAHGGHGKHHDPHEPEEEQEAAKEVQKKEEEPKEEKEEAKEEPKKEEPKEEKKEEKTEEKTEEKKDEGESKAKKPSDTDSPDPRGEPKSTNEMSGKQDATYSNQDAHHPVDVGHSDDKSSKGEGVAETAKVKGTVSPERPPAENKEERGKKEMDKNK
ncbi:hypothetical protein M011DRAFT_451122 [Sporormia fimetaria CBS 119925]|uniref:Uncharacterized protein n=1 Tax=Sporormia fimetaria CBS 119925 TaxID=1340428 RepID=A0A6A6V0W0_9PLEO|nr:hypothetical protein M011DRAFT_451122 [Sporormia fimetaria CBS 119925]